MKSMEMKMKTIIKTLILLLVVLPLNVVMANDDITGTWQGKLSTRPDFEMTVQFVISQDANGSFSVIVSSPESTVMEGTRANSVNYDSGNLKVGVAELNGSYEGNLKDGKITGEWKQEGSSFPLILSSMENYRLTEEVIDMLLGEWHIAYPSLTGPAGVACKFRFQLTEDGELEGSMDETVSGLMNVPLADFQMTDADSFMFRILAKPRRVFEGKVDGDRIIGALQFLPGAPFYSQLVKKGEYKPGEPGKALPDELKEKLTGKWHGTLGASTLTFTFGELLLPGTFMGLIENPDPETEGWPFTDSIIDGEKITLITEYIDAKFTGELSGDTLEGEWMRDGKREAVSLVKEYNNMEYAGRLLAQDGMPDLDAAKRSEIIEDLAGKLASDYAIEETGLKMADTLRKKLESQDYDNVTSPFEFARILTEDLSAVAHDKHLSIVYNNATLQTISDEPPSPDVVAKMEESIRNMNGAIAKVEILDGNVGYMRINGVPAFEFSKDAISAAFASLKNTDALILDNRGNGGGDPNTVAWYMSYLSEGAPYVVNTFHHRKGNRIEEFKTTDLGDLSYGAKKPVFVLTSSNTFSGGEEMTYDIQVFKRGIIVGEVTGGGANPTGPVPLVHNFMAIIPYGYAVNPITGSNWEGTGVKPDVEVPAAEALKEAHRLAVKRLQEDSSGPR